MLILIYLLLVLVVIFEYSITIPIVSMHRESAISKIFPHIYVTSRSRSTYAYSNIL